MIIVTTKNADNTYKARINGFDTTITRDEAAQFILAGKLCRKVNQPYTSLAQLDHYVFVETCPSTLKSRQIGLDML